MEIYSQQDIEKALEVINSIIPRCEKAQLKFKEGTSQFSLLKNRIKALKISKCLLESNDDINSYSDTDIEKSLPPINSIIHKTETARKKFEKGSTQYKRLTLTIEAMYISKYFIENILSK